MKMRLFAALGFAVLAFSVRADEGEALLWMVDADATVNDRGVIKKIGEYQSPTGDSITHARVAADDGDGATVYLNFGIDVDGEIVMTEVSILQLQADCSSPPVWAAFSYEVASAVSFAIEDYSFRIELGTGTADAWKVLAVSETQTFAELEEHFQGGAIDIPAIPWNPSTYAVPEPTGSILFILGGALLALRRKRKIVSEIERAVE